MRNPLEALHAWINSPPEIIDRERGMLVLAGITAAVNTAGLATIVAYTLSGGHHPAIVEIMGGAEAAENALLIACTAKYASRVIFAHHAYKEQEQQLLQAQPYQSEASQLPPSSTT